MADSPGLDEAKRAIRTIERFVYKELSKSEEEKEVVASRNLLRITVGLRRKLDTWKEGRNG